MISIFCGLYCHVTISDSEFLGNGDKTGCIVSVYVFSPSFALFFFKVVLQFRVHWTRGCAAIRKEGLREASPATDYTACSLVLSHSFLPSSLYSTGYTFTDSLSINVQAV